MIFKEFLQPIVSALEQIENNSKNNESIKRAHSLLNDICNFNFLVAICVSNKLLSFIYNLSEYLQTKNIDLVNAFGSVSEVSKKLQDTRENSNVEFHEIFKGVKSIAILLNVNDTIPRICDRQKNSK